MTNVINEPGRRPAPGRPPAFDRNVVLEAAMTTFWDHGYEGTSIADLTKAMGISAQSLYAAFTSKAKLYREALIYYQDHVGVFTNRALEEEPDVLKAFEQVLTESAHQFSVPHRPHGCMISTEIVRCASENEPVSRDVSKMREAIISDFRKRFEKGIRDGALRPETDAQGLARYVGAMIQGMSIQARDGARKSDLLRIARLASNEIKRHRQR
jgi:AcrR family transcriptional regulator